MHYITFSSTSKPAKTCSLPNTHAHFCWVQLCGQMSKLTQRLRRLTGWNSALAAGKEGLKQGLRHLCYIENILGCFVWRFAYIGVCAAMAHLLKCIVPKQQSVFKYFTSPSTGTEVHRNEWRVSERNRGRLRGWKKKTKKEWVDWHSFEFELLPNVPQSEPQ